MGDIDGKEMMGGRRMGTDGGRVLDVEKNIDEICRKGKNIDWNWRRNEHE